MIPAAITDSALDSRPTGDTTVPVDLTRLPEFPSSPGPHQATRVDRHVALWQ